MNGEILWTPSRERIERSQLSRFARAAEHEHGLDLSDYAKLHAWSIAAPEQFWRAVVTFCGISLDGKHGTVLRPSAGGTPWGVEWFPEATLNFAGQLLRRNDDSLALIALDERGRRATLTYRELRLRVARLAHHLRSIGVERGDRVAAFIPNCSEAVIGMLATTSLGAIWTSCSPDFGVQGVRDRFEQVEPKVLIAHDGYSYAGKRISSLERVEAVVRALPSLRQTLIVPFLDDAPQLPARAVNIQPILEAAFDPPLLFERLPFNHPVYILYSSGTTGVPKCIVHGAGGTLLQLYKELVLHTDLRPEERIFYFTTCGWMMWNWLVSALGVGATAVLYDGSPFYPTPSILIDIAEREQLAVFGTSAKYLAALQKAGVRPQESHNLESLRTILSTGSPLATESFDYVYRDLRSDVQLASISGGTDIVSCFALGCPWLPVRRGELQAIGLGMAVDVVDERGAPLRSGAGELVCTKPFPSSPVAFWNDPTGEKYFNSYFNHFPGIWRHGDWAERSESGGLVIYGRSDATLNPGGVRIGTAEIYRVIEPFPEILECLAVGQPWQDDVRVILFVKMREGNTLTTALCDQIRTKLRTECSPRHVPAKILQAPDIPRTISGKITELAVRDIIAGREVKNSDALANPQALDFFRSLPELQEA